MSLQELHIRALEDQVVNLTRDCHYLMSLLNSTDEIDWDNWDQGRKIKEDLERSKEFFDTIKRREDRFAEYDKVRKEAELLKKEEREKARKQYENLNLVKNPRFIAQKNYFVDECINNILSAFETFRF